MVFPFFASLSLPPPSALPPLPLPRPPLPPLPPAPCFFSQCWGPWAARGAEVSPLRCPGNLGKSWKITWKLLVLDGLIMFFFMIFVDMLLVFCWMAFQDGFQCSVRVFGLNGLIKVQLGRKLYIKWYILTTGTIGFRSLYHYPWYRIWGCSGNCMVVGWMVNTGINITDIWLIIDGYWWFKIIVQWYTTEQTILGDRINIFC